MMWAVRAADPLGDLNTYNSLVHRSLIFGSLKNGGIRASLYPGTLIQLSTPVPQPLSSAKTVLSGGKTMWSKHIQVAALLALLQSVVMVRPLSAQEKDVEVR